MLCSGLLWLSKTQAVPFPKPEELKLELRGCRDKAGLWGGGKGCSLEGIWVALHSARRGMAHVEASRMSAHTH